MSLTKGKQIQDHSITAVKVDGSIFSTDGTNTPPVSDYTALSKKVTNLANGTAANDAVNLSQLQAVQQGMAWKAACETGTIAADGSPEALPNAPTFAGSPGVGGTLTATVNAALVVGGVNVTKLGQRVLVTSFSGPVDGPKNGIYELTQAGSAGPVPPAAPWILTRVADMDVTAEVPRATTTIDNANSYAFGKVYVVSDPLYPPGAFVLNTDIISWASLPLPTALVAGQGISISGLTISTDIEATPSASGRGLTYVGNKLSGDIEPNKGLKFNDVTGRFETLLTSTPNVEGGITYGANGGLAAKFEANSGLTIGPNSGIVINPKTAVAISATGGLALISNELVAKTNQNAGARVNASNEIETFVEPSTPTDGGLEYGPNGGIQVKTGNGIQHSATGIEVKAGNPANSAPGLTVAASGVYNDVTGQEQFGAASVTTASQQIVLAGGLAQTPWKGNGGNALVRVAINGVSYRVGVSIANDALYYSNDGGVTARALNQIAAGDVLYRGGGLGFDTDATDEVVVTYDASVP